MSTALRPESRVVWHVLETYLAPALCILLPVLFYLAIFQPVVVATVLAGETSGSALLKISPSSIVTTDCVPVDKEKEERPLSAEDLSTIVTSNDLAGRYFFAIASAIIRLMSIVAIAFSFLIISHRTTMRRAIAMVAVGAAAGIVITLLYRPETIDARHVLVFPIMDAVAQLKSQTSFVHDVPQQIVDSAVAWNLRVGVISTAVVLVGFAAIARPARLSELTTRRLKERLFDLQRFIIVMAIVSVLTVIMTKSMISWQLGFLCDSERLALTPLGAALGNYWGAASTGVILAAVLPAYFSWRNDVERYSVLELHEKSEREKREFLAGEGLEFAPASSFPAVLAVATPALSGPLLDLVSPVFFR